MKQRRLKLYVGFYEDSSAERNAENLECLKRNSENPFIDEIWLFVEDPQKFQHLASSKVRITTSRQRWCTFSDFMTHANMESEDFLLLVANTDIYFDETLAIAKDSISNGELFLIGRRDIRADGTAVHTEHLESSDAWLMFAPTYDFACDIRLGTVGCESTFLAMSQLAGYKLKNVSTSVAAFHLHITQKRNIDPNTDRFTDRQRMVFPLPESLRQRRSIPQQRSKIMIDASYLAGDRLSATKAWLNILLEWRSDPIAQQITLLTHGEDRDRYAPYKSVIGTELNPGLPISTSVTLEAYCREHDIDLFISTNYDSPLDTPTLSYVYDMTSEALHGCRELNGPLDSCTTKYRTILGAKKLFVPSNSTKSELLHVFPNQTKDKIILAPYGVSSNFGRVSTEDINQFKARYDIDRPFYMFVGARTGYCGHRNAELLFSTLGQMPNKDAAMILCIGGEGQFDTEHVRLLNGVKCIGIYPNDLELCAAYSSALALVHPVLHSGFPTPILEAMRCGCPVIASRPAALPELTGGHVFTFDLWNKTQFAELLEMMHEPTIRETHLMPAYEKSLEFNWTKTAQIIKQTILESM